VKARIILPAGLALQVRDQRGLLESLARIQARAIRARATVGLGAEGPLPRSGATPWVDTGQLLASVGVVSREGKRGPEAIVRALGMRLGRDNAAGAARARQRNKARRAAANSGIGVKVKIKARRIASTNAGLAAILSQPDPRPRHRKRVYRVIGATVGDESAIGTQAERIIKVLLTAQENPKP
jgi:hypothetical protein